LTNHPALPSAIEAARTKIQNKARAEVAVLTSNLGIILRDFCDQHGIVQIPWASATDLVAPGFALDHLADRLSQMLTEIRFTEFLTRFCDDLIELGENEKRSQ
jgi:hypothetical protein